MKTVTQIEKAKGEGFAFLDRFIKENGLDEQQIIIEYFTAEINDIKREMADRESGVRAFQKIKTAAVEFLETISKCEKECVADRDGWPSVMAGFVVGEWVRRADSYISDTTYKEELDAKLEHAQDSLLASETAREICAQLAIIKKTDPRRIKGMIRNMARLVERLADISKKVHGLERLSKDSEWVVGIIRRSLKMQLTPEKISEALATKEAIG